MKKSNVKKRRLQKWRQSVAKQQWEKQPREKIGWFTVVLGSDLALRRRQRDVAAALRLRGAREAPAKLL
jgi:hypothetical protein